MFSVYKIHIHIHTQSIRTRIWWLLVFNWIGITHCCIIVHSCDSDDCLSERLRLRDCNRVSVGLEYRREQVPSDIHVHDGGVSQGGVTSVRSQDSYLNNPKQNSLLINRFNTNKNNASVNIYKTYPSDFCMQLCIPGRNWCHRYWCYCSCWWILWRD